MQIMSTIPKIQLKKKKKIISTFITYHIKTFTTVILNTFIKKMGKCITNLQKQDIPSECFELLDNKIQGPFSVLSFGFVRRKRQPAGLKIKLPPDTIVVEADIDGHNTFIEQKMVACLFKKEMFANESRELQLPINLTSLEHIEQRTALATMLNTLFDFQMINPSQGEPVLRERTKAEKQKKKPIQKRILPKRKRKETTENTSIASTTNTTSTASTEKKVKQLFYNSSFEALKQVVEQNVKEETNEIKQKSEALLEVLNECIMSTDGQVGPDDLTEPEDNFDISDPKIINTSTSRLSESGSLSQTPLEYFQQVLSFVFSSFPSIAFHIANNFFFFSYSFIHSFIHSSSYFSYNILKYTLQEIFFSLLLFFFFCHNNLFFFYRHSGTTSKFCRRLRQSKTVALSESQHRKSR